MPKRVSPSCVRARAKSSRFCTPAHCLFRGSLTRGFSSRLDAPFCLQVDRVIPLQALRARAKSSRFCTPAHCLFRGSLTRGFSSRLDAPFRSRFDRIILARALRLRARVVHSTGNSNSAASRIAKRRARVPRRERWAEVQNGADFARPLESVPEFVPESVPESVLFERVAPVAVGGRQTCGRKAESPKPNCRDRLRLPETIPNPRNNSQPQ